MPKIEGVSTSVVVYIDARDLDALACEAMINDLDCYGSVEEEIDNPGFYAVALFNTKRVVEIEEIVKEYTDND